MLIINAGFYHTKRSVKITCNVFMMMNRFLHITFLLFFYVWGITVAQPASITDSCRNKLELPLGSSRILQEVQQDDAVIEIVDRTYLDFDTFIQTFQIGQSVQYDSLVFKEDDSENHTVREKSKYGRIVEFILSVKYIQTDGTFLRFAIQKPLTANDRNLSVFLLLIKDGSIIDSRKIYFHEEREMGYTYERRFYIDKNMIVSTRDYAFTEDGIEQTAFKQYQINTHGKFEQYKRGKNDIK